ncbi:MULTISPECIES: methyl-accepting chemotaxis protein [Burkholderia]|uniref:MCP four helix bundle domain-containing protein n=2 Tax=Burkholderia anthina TaxID=179879 RepID=A0ABS2B3N2_9BURK|nr:MULTISPECIES: methyl-accepting chemotaxis protein [Burkholderia]MBM2767584.1 MCP four helix bundle domain-containing protein [Burkholderia anthina]
MEYIDRGKLMKIGRLKMRTRLTLAFGALMMLFVTGGLVSLSQLREANARISELVDDGDVKLALAENLSRQVYIGVDSIKTVLLVTDGDAIEALVKRGYAAKQQFMRDRETLRVLNRGSAEASKLVDAIFETNDKRTVADFDQFVTLAKQGQHEAAGQWLVSRAAPSMQALQDTISRFIEFQRARNAELKSSSAADFERSKLVLAAVLMMCLIAIAGIGVVLTRSLRRELGVEPSEARDVTSAVAQGDLSCPVPVRGAPAGSLIVSMGEMQAGLRRVIESVRHHAESVTFTSREIALGNNELSARTEEQAASLEETAASMAQLTETVKQNADNARQANSLALHASGLADSGNEAVAEMIRIIKEINKQSVQMSEITSLIEGVAFQTNLLALNAAVEAARAGSQGRGFAVVASEVRGLAQRAATAAKEIKALILSSVAMVQDGVKQAGDVGGTMSDVGTAIKRVSDIVGEISAASDEQSRGIEQVHQAVSQLDEVTQHNAALVEQAAAAAQSLDEQASNLKVAVSVFRLEARVDCSI